MLSSIMTVILFLYFIFHLTLLCNCPNKTTHIWHSTGIPDHGQRQQLHHQPRVWFRCALTASRLKSRSQATTGPQLPMSGPAEHETLCDVSSHHNAVAFLSAFVLRVPPGCVCIMYSMCRASCLHRAAPVNTHVEDANKCWWWRLWRP